MQVCDYRGVCGGQRPACATTTPMGAIWRDGSGAVRVVDQSSTSNHGSATCSRRRWRYGRGAALEVSRSRRERRRMWAASGVHWHGSLTALPGSIVELNFVVVYRPSALLLAPPLRPPPEPAWALHWHVGDGWIGSTARVKRIDYWGTVSVAIPVRTYPPPRSLRHVANACSLASRGANIVRCCVLIPGRMADGGWFAKASEARRARGEPCRVARGSGTHRVWCAETRRWVRSAAPGAPDPSAAPGAPDPSAAPGAQGPSQGKGPSAAHGAPGPSQGKGKSESKGKDESKGKGPSAAHGAPGPSQGKGKSESKGKGKKGKFPDTTLPNLGGLPVGSWPYAPRAPLHAPPPYPDSSPPQHRPPSAAHGAPPHAQPQAHPAAHGAPPPPTSTGSAAHGAPPHHHSPSAAHGAPPHHHSPSAAHGAPNSPPPRCASEDSLPSVMSTW
jgi:hypothetical protein